jgi:hypothetical protein
MSADYKNYLLAKNKASQKNLNVYKAKYETATGKITPEEGQQMLELNDNIVDEEQISNELRELMKKYVPNLQYLDQALNDPRLTDQIKYDLYLNFGTFVEPKINAIRNRKISIEKFVAFLIKLGKDLAQSDLTQNINDNVNRLTNVFRPQINDYEADQAGLSQQDLANTLVAYNIKELEDLGIEESSADGRKTDEIKILIRQLMFIDKLVYNFERAKNKVNPDSSGQLFTNNVDTIPISGTKSELARLFDKYYSRITDPLQYYEVPFRGLQKAYEVRTQLQNNNPDNTNQFGNEEQLDEEQQLNLKAGLPKDYKAPSLIDSLPYIGSHALDKVNNQFSRIPFETEDVWGMRREAKEMKIADLEQQIESFDKRIERKQREINALTKVLAEFSTKEQTNKLSKKAKNERAQYRKSLLEREAELEQLVKEQETLITSYTKLQRRTNEKIQNEISAVRKRDGSYWQPENNDDGEAKIENTYESPERPLRTPLRRTRPSAPPATEPSSSFVPRRSRRGLILDEEEDQNDQDPNNPERVGFGLRKSKSTNGKSPALSQYEQPLVNNKYFINRKKLNANVLEIRYTKNRHLIPIKSQIVGKNLRTLIENIIDSNELDKQQYEKLTKMEQNLLRSLLPYLGRDIDEVDDDEAFYDRFDVIRGELLSGNDNKALKREAKQYLMHALNTGKISRTHFNQMLIDLDL